MGRPLTLAVLLSIAFLARGFMLTRWCGNFESDEAIVGLMAKHILEGQFPVFFYGQFYMGSLESLGAAAIFWLAGDMNGWLLRLSPIAFYLAFMVVCFFCLEAWYNRSTATWAALFLAVPPVVLNKWTYVARGGFTEILFLGTLLLYLYNRGSTLGWSSGRVFSLGLVMGLALWTNPLAVLYLAAILILWVLGSTWWPAWRMYGIKLIRTTGWFIGLGLVAGVVLIQWVFKLALDVLYIQRLLVSAFLVAWVAGIILARWRRLSRNSPNRCPEVYTFWLGLGGILGLAPMIYFFFNPGQATGGQDDFKVVVGQQLPALWRLLFFEILPALIGWRTFTDGNVPILLLLAKFGIAAIFGGAIFVFGRTYGRSLRELILLRPTIPQPAHYITLLGGLTLAFGLVNGNSYDIEHVRYFVPLLFVLAALVGVTLTRLQHYQPAIAVGIGLFLGGYYGVTYRNYYQSLSPTCPGQQVAEYLVDQQVKGGWAYFKHAYNLTFMSQEKVIVAPYHSRERYEAYTQFVTTLPQQTYIMEAGAETRDFLTGSGQAAHFKQNTVSGFNIFTPVDDN